MIECPSRAGGGLNQRCAAGLREAGLNLSIAYPPAPSCNQVVSVCPSDYVMASGNR